MSGSAPRVPIRLLLIEDSPGDARLIQQVLTGDETTAFQVARVSRLADGVGRLTAETFDVVLLDLSLPDSQGIQTFLTVHAKAPRVPIVVLTGLSDEQCALEAVQKGAQDYLGKSAVYLDPHTLTRAIRYAIERKRAEGEHLRLAAFAERNPYPIVEMALGGTVTYVNAAAQEQFPDLETMAAHPVLESLRTAAAILPRSGERSMTRELAYGTKIFEQYISYIQELDAVQSYHADITERKQAERVKDEFLSTVSHELRTPLATIKEFIAILIDKIAGPLTAAQGEYLGIVQSSIKRLSRTINDLLDMAKIEAGRIVLDKQLVDIAALLDHVIRSMRPLLDRKQVALEVRVPPEAPTLFADADKMVQILLNLVNNAVKFTPEQGRITLSVAERPNEIEWSVTDTGIGIAAEDLPKLFEKFQQLSPRENETGSKGTGLGLAISKRLVELHGGRIWVTSVPGTGSTFAFALPKYHPEELFHEYVTSAIEKAEHTKHCFSFVVVNVPSLDDFKTRHGLGETARLLKELEATLQRTVRTRVDGDVVMRWHRGEVVVILTKIDRAGALAMADRIRHALGTHTFTVGTQTIAVPTAVATATYPDEGKTEQALLAVTAGRLQRRERPGARILVIDDEAKTRQFIKEVLELQDYEVFTAASGPDALQQLRRAKADVVLLDLMMPVMDGYEVYHLLREHPATKDVPIVIITAKGERKDRELGLEGPTYNYLTKPFQIEELLAKVREALHRSAPT